MSRAWADAYGRIGAMEYPDNGRAILASFSPALLAAWNEREALAEVASLAFVAEESHQADLEAALTKWEAAVVEAIRHLNRTCHGCGRKVNAAIVLDDGQRACSRCLDVGTGTRHGKEGL
jgi:hypothetical protein